jgi:heme/copper-type cytochrome/quinol oxidase subunit 2
MNKADDLFPNGHQRPLGTSCSGARSTMTAARPASALGAVTLGAVTLGLVTTTFYGAVAHAAPVPESEGQVWLPQFPRDVSANGYLMDDLIISGAPFLIGLFIIMVSISMAIGLGVFLIVDGNLWFNSTYDMHETYWNFKKVDEMPDVVRVELNAHQWAWDFRQAGPDGKFNTKDDVVVLNELRVPINRPVLIQIAATDVLHSLYIPNLRVKQDAVPGSINRAWFIATKEGEYEIGCAQHCGIHHYQMSGVVHVMSEDDHKRWVSAMSKVHERGYDPKDTEAHWGWAWSREKDAKEKDGVKTAKREQVNDG